MDAMEEKLGSILNDPEMMQKIMSMAQSLGSAAPSQETPRDTPLSDPLPQIDMASLQRISGLARQGNIDRDQQALLKALGPYLSRQRIRKLENAMRAAKMAKVAANVLGRQDAKLSTR